MQICTTAAALQSHLEQVKQGDLRIGFVPTMGALHGGHLSLVQHSLVDSLYTVVSIFVNPTQFNNPEDLAKYPRTPDEDLEMLREIGCHMVYMPQVEDIYPQGEQLLNLDLQGLDQVLEGKARPGHFKGMVTVVNRLFDIVKPDVAYLGEKDFQQLTIVRFMVEKLKLPITVIGGETIRHDDGLAMSSRNKRLIPEDRKAAVVLYKALDFIRRVEKAESLQPSELIEKAKKIIKNEPTVVLDYLEIVNEHSLQPIENWKNIEGSRALIAASIGNIRLIDNMPLTTFR